MNYTEMAEELLEMHVQLRGREVNQEMEVYARGEIRALSFLYDNGQKAYPGELSQEMGVSTARIAVLIKRMEEKGWVTRSADTQDSRHIIVSLTPAGMEVLQHQRNDTIGLIANALERLGEEDAKTYLRIRKKMLLG